MAVPSHSYNWLDAYTVTCQVAHLPGYEQVIDTLTDNDNR